MIKKNGRSRYNVATHGSEIHIAASAYFQSSLCNHDTGSGAHGVVVQNNGTLNATGTTVNAPGAGASALFATGITGQVQTTGFTTGRLETDLLSPHLDVCTGGPLGTFLPAVQ